MSIVKPSKPHTFANGPGNIADAIEVNENFDTVYSKLSEVIDAINHAAGTKQSIDARLDIAIEEDGTLRASVTAGGEWINPDLSPQYVDASRFSVSGDQADIYADKRRLKITLGTSTEYTQVSFSTYDAGANKTTVTLSDAILTGPITTVEHGVFTPQGTGRHSISPEAITPANSEKVSGIQPVLVVDGSNAVSANSTSDINLGRSGTSNPAYMLAVRSSSGDVVVSGGDAAEIHDLHAYIIRSADGSATQDRLRLVNNTASAVTFYVKVYAWE